MDLEVTSDIAGDGDVSEPFTTILVDIGAI